MLSGLCAWTSVRSPTALASPHAATSCESVIVCWPPSRMLAEANSLMTSAPWALRCRTSARSESGPPLRSVSGSSEVSIRGPGSPCVAIQSRRSASLRDPTLWIVVNPARSVA